MPGLCLRDSNNVNVVQDDLHDEEAEDKSQAIDEVSAEGN